MGMPEGFSQLVGSGGVGELLIRTGCYAGYFVGVFLFGASVLVGRRIGGNVTLVRKRRERAHPEGRHKSHRKMLIEISSEEFKNMSSKKNKL